MNKIELEEGLTLNPSFDQNGFIPCVTQCAKTDTVLMFAYMNDISLHKTIETGEAYYWSRSRGELWHKGASSGLVHNVIEMRIDCDQDCVLLRVEIPGEIQGSCHTGRKGCFYRSVPLGQSAEEEIKMEFHDAERVFDPQAVYAKTNKVLD